MTRHAVPALCGVLLLAASAAAQYPVRVTTEVFPPFSTYLSDYINQPNRLRVTLLSTPGSPRLRVRLLAKLYGVERGIKIASDSNYRPARAINLAPGMPFIVNNDIQLLRELFDVGRLSFEGITREQVLLAGGLPEGTYRLCVRALDYETGAPLSEPEPHGCSGPFLVREYDPPTIIMPAHNSTVMAALPQNVVFRWLLPPGLPPDVAYEYRLKLIELVPPTRDPEEAMASATVPPLFERTVVSATQLLYTSAEPPLVAGRRYAVRVTARDPERQGVFRNDGHSPVVAFNYGQQTQGPTGVTATVSVRSPASPFPEDLADTTGGGMAGVPMTLTISNSGPTDQSVRLLFRMAGLGVAGPGMEQGRGLQRRIVVWTDSIHPLAQPILVPAGTARTVTARQLVPYFTDSLLHDTGMVNDSGLPRRDSAWYFGLLPGRYSLTVRVLDFATGAPLSDPVTSGTFAVRLFDPPQLAAPADTQVVPQTPQNVEFRWNRPDRVRTDDTLQYTLKVVDLVPDTVNPESALNHRPSIGDSLHVIPVLTEATSLVLTGPTMPALQVNHKYAARVRARDIARAGGFLNNGASEPVVFRYARDLPPQGLAIITRISGRVMSQFVDPLTEAKPLANANVKLMLYNLLEELDHFGRPTGRRWLLDPSELALARTDGRGRFTFVNHGSRDTTGAVCDTYIHVWRGSAINHRCLWSKVARVIVDSKNHTNSERNVDFRAGETRDAGDFVARVRSHRLTIRMMGNPLGEHLRKNLPLDNIPVYLLAHTNYPAPFPTGQGSPEPTEPRKVLVGSESLPVVAEARTSFEGYASFTNLVMDSGAYYHLHLYADMKGNKRYNYRTSPQQVHFVPPSPWEHYYLDEWNSELQEWPTDTITRWMDPLKPLVHGEVYAKRGIEYPFPPPGAEVWFDYGGWNRNAQTDEGTGHFVFAELDPGFTGSLYATAPGYDNSARLRVNDGDTLRYGQQVDVGRIILEPGWEVSGSVINEEGQGINSWVTFYCPTYDSTLVTTLVAQWVSIPRGGATPPAMFHGRVPSPDDRPWAIVDPRSEDYFPETLRLYLRNPRVPGGWMRWLPPLQPCTLKRKLHRIAVHVYDSTSKQGLRYATAEIEETGVQQSTNIQGNASFPPFQSSGDHFTILVRGPAGTDYVARRLSVVLPPTRVDTVVPVALLQGGRVAATVTCNGAPVESARVFLDQAGGVPVEAFTVAGACTLRNVPPCPDSLTFRAVRSGFVGASGRTPVAAGQTSNLSFELTTYNRLDLSRMLGFQIEVEELKTGPTGVRISGAFVRLPANALFGVRDSGQRLGFNNVAVAAGPDSSPEGIPYAHPTTLPVPTELNCIPIAVLGQHDGKLRGGTGQGGRGVMPSAVLADTLRHGAIVGRASVDASSFREPAIKFQADRFYVAGPGSETPAVLDLPAITSSGLPPFDTAGGLRVLDNTGGPLSYTLCDFEARADAAGARLKRDTLVLPTTIYWCVRNDQPDRHRIGDVKLVNGRLATLSGNDTTSRALGLWSLVTTSWQFSAGNGFCTQGRIETDSASGGLSVPYQNMYIMPRDSSRRCWQYVVDSLSFRGTIPIKVLYDEGVRFGWDQGEGTWALAVLPPDTGGRPAYVPRLEGMSWFDKVWIDNLYLLSDGRGGDLTLSPGQHLTLYGLVDFAPTSMEIREGMAAIGGVADLGIPMAGRISGAAIGYERRAGQLRFKWVDARLTWTVNGVTIYLPGDSLHRQILSGNWTLFPNPHYANGMFSTQGIVFEPDTVGTGNLFSFEHGFWHTQDSTWLVLDTLGSPNQPAWQRFYCARNSQSKYLDSITGRMKADRFEWGNLCFEGDMVGWDSLVAGSAHLAFEVTGDVKADNQQVETSKIPTPFGSMNIVYDIANGCLLGSLHVDLDLSGASMVADAELCFDREGWYFLLAAQVTIMSYGQQTISSTILVGAHPVNSHIRQKVQEYSLAYHAVGRLPRFFPDTLHGFYFEGGFEFSPVPSFEFNAGICAVSFECGIGVDVAVLMRFDTGTFTIGAIGYTYAELSASASLLLVCFGSSVRGEADVEVTAEFGGESFRGSGDVTLTLTGSAWVGWGICLAGSHGCEGDLCDNHYATGTVTATVGGRFTSSSGRGSEVAPFSANDMNADNFEEE